MARNRSFNNFTILTSDCKKKEASGKVGNAGYHIGEKCDIYIESFRGGKKRIRHLKGINTSKLILGVP